MSLRDGTFDIQGGGGLGFKKNSLARKKNVLVLVIGRVDFDANKKKCGPQNKYNTQKNTESCIFFTCQSEESTFICILSCFMNVLRTGLISISSLKTF